ncbi:MAG: LamG domain-containing protein, partial [Planctomycetes bacterium]|nr:LamG domain-containing protein [Planctomycetota bacterium]
RCWVTETQKEIARVHEVDPSLFEGLWNQGRAAEVSRHGLVLEQAPAKPGSDVGRVQLPNLVEGEGFTIDMWIRLDELKPGQVIASGQNEQGSGLRLLVTETGTIGLELRDGKKLRSVWDTDPGAIKAGRLHHLVAIVEGGPKIIMFVLDGVLLDGGEHRQFGWGRIEPALTDLGGSLPLQVAPSLKGTIKGLRVYQRALRVSQAVSNHRAGLR